MHKAWSLMTNSNWYIKKLESAACGHVGYTHTCPILPRCCKTTATEHSMPVCSTPTCSLGSMPSIYLQYMNCLLKDTYYDIIELQTGIPTLTELDLSLLPILPSICLYHPHHSGSQACTTPMNYNQSSLLSNTDILPIHLKNRKEEPSRKPKQYLQNKLFSIYWGNLAPICTFVYAQQYIEPSAMHSSLNNFANIQTSYIVQEKNQTWLKSEQYCSTKGCFSWL